MPESKDYISLDMETILLGGKQHLIQTASGVVSVIVYGDQAKPALITYPDLALNHFSCFQGLFFCPEAASLLLHHFCIYHISPPGHELGAAPISPHQTAPCVEGLADQILQVLNHFSLGAVMCMGVTAGAYVLTLFALKYHRRVLGLIMVSPLCKSASWTEWICNKLLSNLLYFYGMSNYVEENLIRRYFGKRCTRGGYSDAEVHESDTVRACRKLLDERQSTNVLRFLQAMNDRPDISGKLEKLNCRTLIFVGELSPFRSEALHMSSKLQDGKKYNNGFVEVRACGSMVTEEEPHAMLVPMELFFMGYGLFRPKMVSGSPTGPLNPPCISPEELSPESLGLNLKPIRTRLVKSHQ